MKRYILTVIIGKEKYYWTGNKHNFLEKEKAFARHYASPKTAKNAIKKINCNYPMEYEEITF